MKIAITGHTQGIGKGLYDCLSSTHEVKGFSRSNGYSIVSDQELILNESKDFDVFINNAQVKNYQVTLFNKLYTLWKNENKTIVNIGSFCKYDQFLKKISEYENSKINLNKFI